MFVYHPQDLFSSRNILYLFIDFLARLINEDKVRVTKSHAPYCSPGYFDIWLVEANDVAEEIKISFAYESYKGRFVGTVSPTKRFRFELIKGVVSLLLIESSDAESYDKMLELFKATLSHAERHDPNHYKKILEKIDLRSLPRTAWRKSKSEIEEELSKSSDMRMATENLQRKKDQALIDLTNEYKRQGYKITD